MNLIIKSKNRIDSRRYTLLLFTIFLFPVLPQFIYLVGPVNTVNFSVATVIGLFFLIGKFPTRKVFSKLPLFWAYELFCAVYFFIDDGVVKAASWFLSFICIPYLIICTIDTEKRFHRAIDSLILGGAVLDIFGIIEEILGYNFFQQFAPSEYSFFSYNYRYGFLRIMTTFGQPIGYGIYQVFVIALILYRLKTNISKKYKTMIICVSIFSIINTLFTVSRTPIIMMILLILIEFLQTKKELKVKRFLMIFIVLFATILIKDVFSFSIPFIDDITNSIQMIGKGNYDASTENGFGQRFELFYWVVTSMNGHWLLGTGIANSFSYKVNDWQTKTSIENGYLDLFFRTGTIGLLFYCCMMFWIVGYLYKNRKIKLPGEKKSFYRIILTVLILYLIALFGVQETDLTRMFVIIVSLIIAYKKSFSRVMVLRR